MNKIRYAEKKYLCEYDLDIELFESFGIEVNDLIPSRSVYFLFTNKGKKILKLLDCDVGAFEFITTSLDYIKDKYNNVVNFNKSVSGEYIVKRNEKLYILMDVVEGREANFSNPIDVSIASRELANINKASYNIMNNIKKEYKNYISDYEDLFNNYIKVLDEIENGLLKVKYKNEFDDMFINSYKRYRKYMISAVDYLNKNQYKKYLNNDEKLVFLHQDLINHNIIIRDDRGYFIDFDYGKLGLKVQDIRNLIVRVVKNSAYDINKAIRVLDEYEKVEKLDTCEKNILSAILEFPLDYCSIVKDYYYKNKQWEEEVFISRFKSKLEFEEERVLMIKALKEKLNRD